MSNMWQRIKGIATGQSWPSFVSNLFTKSNYRDLNQESERGLEDDLLSNNEENSEWSDVTDAGCHRKTFSPVLIDDLEKFERVSLNSTEDSNKRTNYSTNGQFSKNFKSSKLLDESQYDDISGKYDQTNDVGKENRYDREGKHVYQDFNRKRDDIIVHGDLTNEHRGIENVDNDINNDIDNDNNEETDDKYGHDDLNEITPHVFSPYRHHENNTRKTMNARQISSSIQQEVTGVVHVIKQRRYSKLEEDSDEIEELPIHTTEPTIPEETPWHDTFPVPKQKQKSIGRSRSKKVWKKTRKAVRVTWKWLKRSFVTYSSSVNYGVPINVAMFGGSRQRGRRHYYDYR